MAGKLLAHSSPMELPLAGKHGAKRIAQKFILMSAVWRGEVTARQVRLWRPRWKPQSQVNKFLPLRVDAKCKRMQYSHQARAGRPPKRVHRTGTLRAKRASGQCARPSGSAQAHTIGRRLGRAAGAPTQRRKMNGALEVIIGCAPEPAAAAVCLTKRKSLDAS